MTTQIGAFQLNDPLPELENPRLLVALQPWVDVGSVGTMALDFLQEAWKARPLAQLSSPGTFYDFTRYRPITYLKEGQREVSVPNSFLHHGRSDDGRDWLLLHALEPHSHGEDYVDSLVELMGHLGVRHYCLIGSMYAPVPHTRPLIVSGRASDEALQRRLRELGMRESTYEGPTTIFTLIVNQAQQLGIDTLSMVLQLPAYTQMERDYRGLHTLLALLSSLHDLSLDLDSLLQESGRQGTALDDSLAQEPRVQAMIRELEATYDAEEESADIESPKLSPELERFLHEIEARWGEPESG
ncbi:MAG: PAC2 family protein [Dehalococcoidia bacterium]